MKKIIQIFIMLLILPASSIIEAASAQDLLDLLTTIDNSGSGTSATKAVTTPVTSKNIDDDDKFVPFPDTDEDDGDDTDDDDDDDDDTDEKKFIQAANKGDIAAIMEDLQDEIDINTIAYGYTALQAAAMNGHADVIKLLLGQDADKTIMDISNKTAYDLASKDLSATVKESLNPNPTEETTRLARVAEEDAARAKKATEQTKANNDNDDDNYDDDDDNVWLKLGKMIPESWKNDPYIGS